MKKFILVAVAFSIAFAFTSCKKDGQFSPKEKIKSIYLQGSIEYDKPFFSEWNGSCAKYLDEKWTWDGKKLKTIDSYNTDGSLYETIQLTYDSKDRFDRIIYSDYQLQFRYDGSKLAGIDAYVGTSINQSYTFTYDGKHISRVDFVNYNSNKEYTEEMKKYNPLSLLFDREIANNMMNFVNYTAKKTRGMTTGSYTLTWSKNNISNISGTITSSSATTSISEDYEYDSHKNPQFGFYHGFSSTFMSENNITGMRSTLTQGTIRIDENITINYTYKGDFPQIATKVHHGVDTDGYRYYTYYNNDPEYYPSYTRTTITEYQY
ncbi:MAG: hypothetical protein J6T48_06475 [Bacteroidales bacterium]|nr:hypothetical protein [Bacteroidales bacterium]